jgi:hypothetical protein
VLAFISVMYIFGMLVYILSVLYEHILLLISAVLGL